MTSGYRSQFVSTARFRVALMLEVAPTIVAITGWTTSFTLANTGHVMAGTIAVAVWLPAMSLGGLGWLTAGHVGRAATAAVFRFVITFGFAGASINASGDQLFVAWLMFTLWGGLALSSPALLAHSMRVRPRIVRLQRQPA